MNLDNCINSTTISLFALANNNKSEQKTKNDNISLIHSIMTIFVYK